jgi:iron complex outermembrane receptor protein
VIHWNSKSSVVRRAALFAGCAVAAITLPGVAQAQDTPQTETNASEGNSEIVVTAQRRREALEKVPMSVTVLQADTIEKANVTNMHEIGLIAPGVQMNWNGSASQPSIRGITSLTNGTGNENNVAVYVDGFYISDNTSIDMDLVNLESIQVLKGPQGALYGRNATGGAILVKTLDPSSVFTGKFEGSYGRFDEKQVKAYISGPIAKGLAFSVAGSLRDSDGWIKLSDPTDNTKTAGDAAPIKQRNLRAKLKADITDNFTATLAYNHAYSNNGIGLLFSPFTYQTAAVKALPANQKAPKPGTAAYNDPLNSKTKVNEVTLTMAWDTDIGTLTSYSLYSRKKFRLDFDVDGTYAPLSFIFSSVGEKMYQQGVDFVIDAIDNVNLVIGANYFRDEYQHLGNGQTTLTNDVQTRRAYRNRVTQAYAVYADATIQLTDKLSIGAGGRYTHEPRRVDNIIFVPQTSNVVPILDYRLKTSFSRFTPRATIRYEIANRTNIYASYSKGFRSGSYSTSPQMNQGLDVPIKGEDVQAYEVGFKTVQRKWRFESAFFYYDYKNLNVSLSIPSPLCDPNAPICPPVNVVGNAPKAKIYGIDGQLVASPVERFNVTVGAAWVHARYGKFPNATGTGVNAANTLNQANQIQDWSGQQLARAPNFSAQLAMDYTVPLGFGDLRLAGNVKYSDSYVLSNSSLYGPLAPIELQNKQRFRQPSTTIVNADITWFSPDERYSVGIWGKNLTSENYFAILTSSGGGNNFQPAAPTSYGVRVGYRF